MVDDDGHRKARYVCINCGAPSRNLFRQFDGGAIRLTACKICKKPVDKYIEYDIVLVIIDVTLQYLGAYRHVLLNREFHVYHKLFTVFVLCDAYKKWIEWRSASTTDKVYDLEWKFYECLLQSVTEMFAFFVVIFISAAHSKRSSQFRRILESTCAGYFVVFSENSVTKNVAIVFIATNTAWVVGDVMKAYLFVSDR
ncbi:Protein ARV1 [Toxocara canis]|uniref:Protein ARV n=1 Tax=Toxocara canis TaxID=6265 RepID=A0A0B2UX82_TOXCA|nr:Protein ARV1 [Toxocara canis]